MSESARNPSQPFSRVYDSLFADNSMEAVVSRFEHLPTPNKKLGAAIQWFRTAVPEECKAVEGIAALVRFAATLQSKLRVLVIVEELSLDKKRELQLEFQRFLPHEFEVNLVTSAFQSTTAVARYNSESTNPQILLIPVCESDRSMISGLDLPSTHMTIFETAVGSASAIVQTLGRSLRIQPDAQRCADHKHLIVLERVDRGPPPLPISST